MFVSVYEWYLIILRWLRKCLAQMNDLDIFFYELDDLVVKLPLFRRTKSIDGQIIAIDVIKFIDRFSRRL